MKSALLATTLLLSAAAMPAFAADPTPAPAKPATMAAPAPAPSMAAPTTTAAATPAPEKPKMGHMSHMKHEVAMKKGSTKPHEMTTDQLNQQQLDMHKS